MDKRRVVLCIAAFAALGISLSQSVCAQQPSPPSKAEDQPVTPGIAVNAGHKSPNPAIASTTGDNAGIESGGYEIKQAVELGGQVASFSGNPGMWDTHVNFQLTLSPAKRSILGAKSQAKVENYAAYDLFLKGRCFWNKRTMEDFHQAIGYFSQAVAADPNYARAYAGLADSYALLGWKRLTNNALRPSPL
jgi:tetratricopeptide (TPR) repeat protein